MPTSKDLTDLDSQLKKTVISAEKFKRGSSLDSSKNILNIHKTLSTLAGHTRKLTLRFINLEKVVNNSSRKISILTNLSKSQSARISGENIGAKLPGSSSSKVEDNISAIAKSVNSIAEILAGRKKITEDAAAYERRRAEKEKRGLAESKLEKVFKGIAKTAEKIISPVKSLLDRILDFIGTVILGRIVFKIIEWLGDPKNQSKVKSIIRFFKDWGPTLLSLYIVFGTSFGKFARGLISLVIKSTVRLGAAVAGLAVKAGIGKAGGKLSKVAGFLGGRKGKLLAAGLEAGVTVAGTVALSNTLKGDGGDKAPEQPTQKFSGGGLAIPRFSGGGFNFKGMLSGAGKGAMFGPLGMLLGGAMGGSSGLVSGPGGPKDDKVPAMLSDGEFVMSAGAVQKYGVDTLEAMNAAGGGTNKPKVVGGTTYAASGGPIGNMRDDPNYKDPILDRRLDMIKSIENYARSQVNSGGDTNIIKSLNNLVLALKESRQEYSPNNLGPSNLSFSIPRSIPRKTYVNQFQNFVNSSLDPRSYQGFLEQAQNKGQNIIKQGSSGVKNFINSVQERIVNTPYPGEMAAIERENKLMKSGELKPGAALTKTTQANLDKRDTWVKSLYNPQKDKGPLGNIKKINQDIQNRGLIPDLASIMGLKEEGTEKFVEKITAGKVKNLGAKITGLQYAVKGLMGPLGNAFRIDDRGSLGRYVRPAILEAQRRGQGGVGAVGLGQTDYNRLMGDKLANLALGQFNFNVDKSGKATTDDTYEANKTAEEYFKTSRKALSKGDVATALFTGVSGVLRINQNTGWGNLRPGGKGIDLGGGFTPTDPKTGKPISPSRSISKSSVTLYGENDPRRKQSGSYKSRFARPKNAGVKPIKPPTSPKPKIVYGPPAPPKRQYRGGQRASTRTPSFSATNPKASNAKAKVVGVKG